MRMVLMLLGLWCVQSKKHQRLPPSSLRRPKIPTHTFPVVAGRSFRPFTFGGGASAGGGAGEGGGGGGGPPGFGGSIQEGMHGEGGNRNERTSFALLMLFDAFTWYSNELTEHPIITKVLTSMLLGLFGDFCCQKLEGKKKNDIHRLFIFSLIQGLYVAPAVHYWFSYLSNLAFLPVAKVQRALTMMAIDQTVGALTITVGLFFVFEFVSLFVPKFGPMEITKSTLTSAVMRAVEACRTRLKPVMIANWSIWPLIRCGVW